MTRQLRHHPSTSKPSTGLVLANGGLLTSGHALCLSSHPHPSNSPYPSHTPLPSLLTTPAPAIDDHASGAATVETYTVEFNRDGSPLRGYVVGRLEGTGHRFLANHGDRATLEQLARTDWEPIGRRGWVEAEAEMEGGTEERRRNLFWFEARGRL